MNAVLGGMPVNSINKLQIIQHQQKNSAHITPILDHIHWLPVPQRNYLNYSPGLQKPKWDWICLPVWSTLPLWTSTHPTVKPHQTASCTQDLAPNNGEPCLFLPRTTPLELPSCQSQGCSDCLRFISCPTFPPRRCFFYDMVIYVCLGNYLNLFYAIWDYSCIMKSA